MFGRWAGILVLVAAAWPARAVVYGNDKRVEAKDAEDVRIRRIARSVPALVDNEDIAVRGDTAYLDFSKYGKKEHLSRRERFYGQPEASFCSAALIAPDLALTAAHCVFDDKGLSTCPDFSLVFDFAYDDTGRPPTQVPASGVVRCGEIVDAERQGADWAVIRLDRPVLIRRTLAISQAPAPAPGTPLVMIGYPTGLPEKVTFGAACDAKDGGLLCAEIDAFRGNSGSPVLDARTLEIVGVLVNGEEDFRKIWPRDLVGAVKALALRRRPQAVNVVPPHTGGEGVTPAARIRDKISDLLETPGFDGAAVP